MRSNKMITKGNMLWSLNKFSQQIFSSHVWRLVYRICMLNLGVKGIYKFNEAESILRYVDVNHFSISPWEAPFSLLFS